MASTIIPAALRQERPSAVMGFAVCSRTAAPGLLRCVHRHNSRSTSHPTRHGPLLTPSYTPILSVLDWFWTLQATRHWHCIGPEPLRTAHPCCAYDSCTRPWVACCVPPGCDQPPQAHPNRGGGPDVAGQSVLAGGSSSSSGCVRGAGGPVLHDHDIRWR